MSTRYPIFVPSKGRADTLYTMRTFDALGVPYTVVVEPQELAVYRQALGPDVPILVTPHRDKGLTVTRNFIWDHAATLGVRRFWTFDDNIEGLFRLNYNLKTPVADGTIMEVIEDFADRYQNITIAGMNYFMFAPRKTIQPPLVWNTRVYSNMLIDLDAIDPATGKGWRNVTFFNDDTDLCIRILKAGQVTALFNAFLIGKRQTMTTKGGMTEYYEATSRRRQFAEELRDAHPDCVEVTWKFKRWHHQVDYSRWAGNEPRFRSDFIPIDGTDNRGMILEKIDAETGSWYEIDRPEPEPL